MVVEVGAHIRVPQSSVDMEQLRRDLCIRDKMAGANKAFNPKADSRSEYILAWEEDWPYVVLPRGYEPPWRGSMPQHVRVAHLKGWKQEPRCWPDWQGPELDPGRDQLKAWQALCSTETWDKTLALGCGRGKSMLALKYAKHLAMPTIILVDRELIGRQWLDYAKAYLGLEPEHIGWIQDTRASIGQQLTIAIVHTLRNRIITFPREFWDHFGLVIIDEVHVMGAQSFREVVPMFSGERLGLSATLGRRDGLEATFMLHLGGMEPCYTNTEPMRSKRWQFLSMPKLVDGLRERFCYKEMGGSSLVRQEDGSFESEGRRMFLLQKYYGIVSEHEGWFYDIAQRLYRLHEEGRHILVLGVQIRQLEKLCELLEGWGCSVGQVDAQVKQEERKLIFSTKRIILATEKLAGKALDIPRLDTLMLLVPYDDLGRLRQESERIGRDTKSTVEPLVIVYEHTGNKTLAYKAKAMEAHVKSYDAGAVITKAKAIEL